MKNWVCCPDFMCQQANLLYLPVDLTLVWKCTEGTLILGKFLEL